MLILWYAGTIISPLCHCGITAQNMGGGGSVDFALHRYLHQAVAGELTFSNLIAKPTSFADTEWLGDCLDTLMTLCFKQRHRLPTMRLEPGSFYVLEDWHLRWFERCSEAKAGPTDRARVLLIPVFRDLNSCFQKVSWFVPDYEIEWTVLSRILEGYKGVGAGLVPIGERE